MVVRTPPFDSRPMGVAARCGTSRYQDFRDATADGRFASRWRTGWSSGAVAQGQAKGEREDGRDAQQHRSA